MLDKLLEEINRLKLAEEILNDVLLELGQNQTGLSSDTIVKIYNYFKYDDDE
jgi:hypothetical protein